MRLAPATLVGACLTAAFLAACSGATSNPPLSNSTSGALGVPAGATSQHPESRFTRQPPLAAVYKLLFSFDSTDGRAPYAGLIDVNGTLYGTTSWRRERRRNRLQHHDGRHRETAAQLRQGNRRAESLRRPDRRERHALRHDGWWRRVRRRNRLQHHDERQRERCCTASAIRTDGRDPVCRPDRREGHALRHDD